MNGARAALAVALAAPAAHGGAAEPPADLKPYT